MTHPAALALIALLLLGAGPPPLPVPPIPPNAHSAHDPAPVPDDDVRAPAEIAENGVRLAPSLFRREKTFVQGAGYMPGSSFKESERERISKPAPGFNLRMTLP